MIVPDYIERSKRKTLSLTVLKNGSVIVKAPINMRDEIITNFVESKQSWIREKLSTIKETQNKFEDVISGEKVMIYGNKYKEGTSIISIMTLKDK